MLTWEQFDEPNLGSLSHYQIIRRNGAVVPFEPNKIANAMMKAFMAVHSTGVRPADSGFLCVSLPSSLLTSTATFKRWILATASSTKQHLFALSKFVGVTNRFKPSKGDGFFSTTKANLRNAP